LRDGSTRLRQHHDAISGEADGLGSARWFAVICAVAIVVLASVVTLTPLATNDLWVHLSVGRETARDILAGKGVPREERFSFTAQGRPLVPHEWLSGVIFYAADTIGGPAAIQALRLFLVLGALAGFARAGRLAGVGWGATSWTLVILLLAVAPRLVERPHLFTYCLAAWSLAALTADARDAGQGGSRIVWLLAPALVLWGNLHGGFIVGVFLIGCFLAAALLFVVPLPPSLCRVLRVVEKVDVAGRRGASAPQAAVANPARAARRRAGRLALVLVAGVAGLAVLNPSGPRLLRFPFELASMPIVGATIYEWRSPFATSYWSSFPFLVTTVWAAVLLVGVRFARTDGRAAVPGGWGASGALIGLAFAVLAVRQMRSVADFVVMTSPWMGSALQGLPLRLRRWRGTKLALSAPALAALVASALIVAYGYPSLGQTRRRPVPPLVAPSIPVAAAEFIAGIPGLPPQARLFNSYPLGGYLAWRLHDRARIYVDSRNEAYGEELTRRALAAFRNVGVFEEEVARWRPDLVVIDWPNRTGSAVLKRLDFGGGWKAVYLDDYVVIYSRNEAPLRPLRFVTPSRLDLRSIASDDAVAALEEGRRLSAWQRDGVIASALTSRALTVLARPQEAEAVLERALELQPSSPALWRHLAAARTAAGDAEGAAQAARRAEKLARRSATPTGEK